MTFGAPQGERTPYDAAEYWTDRLERHWSLRGVGYINYTERYNTYLYRAKLRAMRRMLKLHGVEIRGRSVLDIGPGIGYWLRWYLEEGARVSGLEIAGSAVARLRAAFPTADVMEGDVTRPWPFTEQFDLISAFDVMYHIVDDGAFVQSLRTAAGHLKPGGWLVLTDQLGRTDVSAAAHVRFRALSTYRKVLAHVRCDVQGIYPVYRLLNGGLANTALVRRSRYLQWGMVGLENRLAPLLYHLDAIPAWPSNLRLLVARKEQA